MQGYLIDMTMPAAGAAALQDSAFAGNGPAAASSLSDDSQQAGPQSDSDLSAAPVAGCTAEADATQVKHPDQGATSESGRHGPDGRDASGSATEGRPEAVVPAEAWPEGAPSLLGPTYLAARGCSEVVVGATKRYGLTPQQALQECGRAVEDWTSRNAAKRGLLPKAAQLWEPLRGWQVRPPGARPADSPDAETWHCGGPTAWPGCCRCSQCACNVQSALLCTAVCCPDYPFELRRSVYRSVAHGCVSVGGRHGAHSIGFLVAQYNARADQLSWYVHISLIDVQCRFRRCGLACVPCPHVRLRGQSPWQAGWTGASGLSWGWVQEAWSTMPGWADY